MLIKDAMTIHPAAATKMRRHRPLLKLFGKKTVVAFPWSMTRSSLWDSSPIATFAWLLTFKDVDSTSFA